VEASFNRTMAALGAVITGLLISVIGERPTLIGVIVVFAIATAIVAFSPLGTLKPSPDTTTPDIR
jgi:hypothetical protein